MDVQLQAIVDTQNEIIQTQSEVIDVLFQRLARYMTDSEISELPIVERVRDVSRMIEELKRATI